jgi:hypothetical protein
MSGITYCMSTYRTTTRAMRIREKYVGTLEIQIAGTLSPLMSLSPPGSKPMIRVCRPDIGIDDDDNDDDNDDDELGAIDGLLTELSVW